MSLPCSETSATCAHTLLNDSCTAMPRACPFATGAPQFDFSTTSSSVFSTRGLSASSARRYTTGSWLAAAASSSIIVSITKAECELPTERHQSTDTPYAIPNMQVMLHSPDVGVPVLWWRSVGNSHSAFEDR